MIANPIPLATSISSATSLTTSIPHSADREQRKLVLPATVLAQLSSQNRREARPSAVVPIAVPSSTTPPFCQKTFDDMLPKDATPLRIQVVEERQPTPEAQSRDGFRSCTYPDIICRTRLYNRFPNFRFLVGTLFRTLTVGIEIFHRIISRFYLFCKTLRIYVSMCNNYLTSGKIHI